MLAWAVGITVALIGALWLLQRRLIYLPQGQVPPVESVASGWSEVTLTTTDGLDLFAWYHAPASADPVIIVFNGNAGNRAGRLPLGVRLAAHGLGVLLVDYRGYGGNPGSPTESGLALDARAAVAFVQQEAPEHQVVLFGESLGAAVAIEVATAAAPAALVLRSPFTSLPAAAAEHYPLLPVGLLLWDTYPSDERIGRVRAPVMVIAGSADSIVPAAQSRQIYELARGPKELLIIEGADHNDLSLLAGPRLVEGMLRFLREVVPDADG